MDNESVRLWLVVVSMAGSALSTLASAATWLYVRNSDRHKVTGARITTMEAHFDNRMDQQDSRIAKLEGRVQEAPTHSDLALLHEKVNEVARCASRVEGEVKGQGDLLRIIAEKIAGKGLR